MTDIRSVPVGRRIGGVISGAILLLGLAAALSATVGNAQQGKSLLSYSIDTSKGAEVAAVMKSLPVQRLLLNLANRPRTRREVDATLADSGISRVQLERQGLVRREGESYVVGFPLLTSGDIRHVRATTEVYASTLAAALLMRRAEMEAALSSYDVAGVDRSVVAYVVLGCFSLDWDGLHLAATRGYRKGPLSGSLSARFGPWWVEERSDFSTEKYFWGSHSSLYGPVEFTSFGDHAPASQPRWAFPDIFWRLAKGTGLVEAPASLAPSISAVVSLPLERTAEKSGLVMLALRARAKSVAELTAEAGLQTDDAKKVLDLLVALQYAAPEGGQYRACVPVLASQDRAMVEALRRIGQEVMEKWFAENYERLRADLMSVTPWRDGQPFAEGFYPIWHYLFGAANRKLVEAGLFADPYEVTRLYKGYIPVVFEGTLYNTNDDAGAKAAK